MFANPLWSVLMLVALVGVYGIIRYRHGGPLLKGYENESWFGWIVKFRSWVAMAVASVMVATPDLLVQIAPFDFSPWIGSDYAKLVSLLFGVFMAFNRAVSTKPPGEAS